MSESLLDQATARNGMPKAPEVRIDAAPRNITGTISPEMISSKLESPLAERARRDFAAARSALEAFAAFEADVLNDPTLTPDARKLSVYDGQNKAADRAVEIIAKLADALSAAETEAAATLTREAGLRYRGKFDQEIRAHVARLSPADRASFVVTRAAAGDTDAVAAVLDSPFYLTGIDLPTEMVIKLQEQVRRKAAPEAAARLDEIRAISERAMNGWNAAMALVPARDERLENLRSRARARSASGAKLGVA